MAKKKFVLTAKTLTPLLMSLDACDESMEFVRSFETDSTFEQLYNTVRSPDVEWLPWLMTEASYKDDTLRLACVQKLMDCLPMDLVQRHDINHPLSKVRNQDERWAYRRAVREVRRNFSWESVEDTALRSIDHILYMPHDASFRDSSLGVAADGFAAVLRAQAAGKRLNVANAFRKVLPWTQAFEDHLVECGRQRGVDGF